MATEYQVQTIQEAPEIEKARLALLKTAEREVSKPRVLSISKIKSNCPTIAHGGTTISGI